MTRFIEAGGFIVVLLLGFCTAYLIHELRWIRFTKRRVGELLSKLDDPEDTEE